MDKILVVNNDVDTMSLLQELLERKHYHVQYTSSRDEVKGIMNDFAPDLLLVDILQRDVITDLKSNPSTAATPIILMTGYSMRQENKHVQSDAVIEKPFTMALLEQKIMSLSSSKIN